VAGVFRLVSALPPPSLPTLTDSWEHSVRVSGQVSLDISRSLIGERATLQQINLAQRPVYGRLQVWLPAGIQVLPGDQLTFSCQLKKPEPIGTFAYDRYLAARGVLALCYRADNFFITPPTRLSAPRAFYLFKNRLLQSLEQSLPEPESSFLEGLLFGGSAGLPEALRQSFADTGLTHILAASGFNLSLFSYVLLSWLLGTAFGRRRALVLVGILIFVYVFLAGATPAVWRAALMSGLILLSYGLRRRPYLPNLFALALVLLLCINPLWLLSDPGFQLSFVATWAVLAVGPRLASRLSFLPATLGLRDSLAASLAAIFFTLPIILWHFGSLSLIAPLANLLILPAVPWLMAGTLITLVVGWFSVSLSVWLGLPLWALTRAVLASVTWLGAPAWASVDVPVAQAFAVLSLILVLSVVLWFYRKKGLVIGR